MGAEPQPALDLFETVCIVTAIKPLTGKEENMKHAALAAAALLLFSFLLPAHTLSSEWWLLGTVKGDKIKHRAISVHLIRTDDPTQTPVSQTMTNTSGQYAFSDPGEGLPPSAYKVVLKVTPELSIDVNLEEMEPRGWMPTLIPPVTVYW